MTVLSAGDSTIVLLTPLDLEYSAMRSFLTDIDEFPHDRGTLFEIGRLGGVPWPVTLVAAEAGNRTAAVMAERAIATFAPLALVVVGIAGALKDDIEIGDVVASSWVYSYGDGKEDDEGFQTRPRAWRSSHRLAEAARAVGRQGEWTASLTTALSAERTPDFHYKPIAAGEVLLNSRTRSLAKQLGRTHNDAAAIEMESAGVADAAHLNDDLPILTVRGISDKADGSKHPNADRELQPAAALHAASFTAALLRKLSAVLSPPTERRSGRMMVQNNLAASHSTMYVVQHGSQYFAHPDN